MIISVFDLDRTLIKENSCRLFLTVLYRKKIIKKIAYFSSISLYLFFKLTPLSVGWLYQTLFKFLMRGQKIRFLEKEARLFYRLQMKHQWNPKVIDYLKQGKKEGHEIWVMTAAPRFLAQYFVRFLKISDFVATDFDLDANAKITGIASIVDGKAKAKKLQSLLEKRAYDQVHVYSDDIDDLPLLNLATHSYVVNPGKKLKTIAQKKGWIVI